MTENEKLRALLAEARGVIDEDYDRGIPSITERIDAALAEPVVDDDIDADLRMHKQDRLRLRTENLRLTRERDEARAATTRQTERLIEAEEEVEKLQAEVERLGTALTQETRLSLSTQRQLDEARAEVERLQQSCERLTLLHKVALDRNDEAMKLCQEAVTQRDYFREKNRLAFQRAAEAMREAAAEKVCDYSVTVLDPFGRKVQVETDGLDALGDIIRALPVPEDKL